ncbi:MAG: dTMP kinase [Clostridiales bacterium]|nr:dTMP kinase [Clostridiales bacterium]
MNKFIVFEGLDGSGKSTQIKMLTNYFKKAGIDFKLLKFPRMEESIIGEMIAAFLRGEFGNIEDIPPYFVALMYAQDRNDAKQMLRESIDKHQYLIVDRYVSSNIAFQCAKIRDEKQRAVLRDWILKLEYEHNALPKPDITFYLKVPFGFVKDTLTRGRGGKDRDYLKGNADIHEHDLNLQSNVDLEYLKLAELDASFRTVDCSTKDGQLLQRSEVHDAIIRLLGIEK